MCLEYVKEFGARSLAVVQFRGAIRILSPADSDRLFAIITDGGSRIRPRLAFFATSAWIRAGRSPPRGGMIYLNVGHTGLHAAGLRDWIDANAVKAVYLIHDLIPITHPHFCRPGEKAKHARRIENALRSATGIIGNSQATLDVLESFAASRGLDMPPAIAAWISGYRLPGGVLPTRLERPHFVTVGTIEGRKNHLMLLEIWSRLAMDMGTSAPLLLIIGQRGWEADAAIAMLKRPELAGHVRELGRCGDRELAAAIAGARALLMPSFAEGFGLPVIEALELRTPVIASDLPVYREIVGDIPTYLPPDDDGAWEQTIRGFIDDAPERTRQMHAMERFRPPDWGGHFERVEKWLGGLGSRGARTAN